MEQNGQILKIKWKHSLKISVVSLFLIKYMHLYGGKKNVVKRVYLFDTFNEHPWRPTPFCHVWVYKDEQVVAIPSGC